MTLVWVARLWLILYNFIDVRLRADRLDEDLVVFNLKLIQGTRFDDWPVNSTIRTCGSNNISIYLGVKAGLIAALVCDFSYYIRQIIEENKDSLHWKIEHDRALYNTLQLWDFTSSNYIFSIV